ncbi:MAG TPA: 2OG-Fe dioxygenase family protein [Burkholderiaceae bacterium]|nr:2OG-Fe dioxygenase family protein [Burkholderiaceae bacterium]
MTTLLLAPPLTPPGQLDAALRERGHAVLAPAALRAMLAATPAELDTLRPSWDELPPDAHLRDGGRYRRRRHSCFVVDGGEGGEGGAVRAVLHRAHWQPLEYNALHGGLERWFEPMRADVIAQPVWARLLLALGAHASALRGVQPWFVEAHQFRIDTEGGIGRPTPEGAHRDGVDLVAVLLIARVGIKGGETRVFEADGPAGLRFTMSEPWTTLLLDDARVVHESTPIQPIGEAGHRDTLVLTFRAGGFQGPTT